jgi:F-type H+-transporting ATPase subunit alpha
MEDQVLVIFAATRGYLDAFPTGRLHDWVNRFVPFVHERHSEITNTIRDTAALSEDVQKKLVGAIEEFNKGF